MAGGEIVLLAGASCDSLETCIRLHLQKTAAKAQRALPLESWRIVMLPENPGDPIDTRLLHDPERMQPTATKICEIDLQRNAMYTPSAPRLKPR